ncbi:stage II sporulation protein M [Lysobacter terrae]
MRQETFVEKHRAEWIAFEQWLDARSGNARKARAQRREWHGLADHEMPGRYRRLCQQLALARRRGYSPVVTDRLQQLMQRGHGVLYRTPAPRWRRAVEFLLAGFPRLVRAEKGVMLAAAAMFVIPLVAMYVAIQIQPDLSSALYDPVQLAGMEDMYDPNDPQRALGRDDQTDVAMFGFYIWNNVSVGFRVFASGLLVGLGPILSLTTEGIRAGAIASHLQAVGHGDPFWRFVCGHAAFELTAIVIAGGAGLRLGLNLVAPGQRRRSDALIEGGRRGGLLCVGVLVMLLIAAFIEAFWSSIGWMPASVKYSVAAVLWTSVFVWLLAGGRNALYTDDEALPVTGKSAA